MNDKKHKPSPGPTPLYGEPMKRIITLMPQHMIDWIDANPGTRADVIRGIIQKAMDDEDGSSTMTRAPKNVIEETKNAYPKEAAYYKAEQYSYASHYAKSSAGRKAMERILNGEDYNQVILDMENEWRKAAEEAVWNN